MRYQLAQFTLQQALPAQKQLAFNRVDLTASSSLPLQQDNHFEPTSVRRQRGRWAAAGEFFDRLSSAAA
jgi:hypothetical protein